MEAMLTTRGVENNNPTLAYNKLAINYCEKALRKILAR
jgi:hypothetical protein